MGTDPKQPLEALQQEVGSPLWLCSLCLEKCDGDLAFARRLTWWIFKVEKVTEDRSEATAQLRASRMADLWMAAASAGAREAESDLAQGKVVELSFGLIRGWYGTCSRCLVRWESQQRLSASGSSSVTSCPRCGSPLMPVRSLGCMVSESTEGRVEGYNRAFEAHIRSKENSEFSWAKVVSQSTSAPS
jgi:hypothetical protein